MYFKEYLRARKSVIVYTLVWVVFFLLTSLLTVWLPMVADPDARKISSALLPQPWPDVLGIAAFAAAILSTVLGSTLSNENDGHLELALTKPYSRDAYVTRVIAVDLAAILVSLLIGFVFMLVHFAIFHTGNFACCQGYRLVAGPDPFLNALHFTLFPLAWYAIIVCLSASLRGAGIVQGLIWPVAIGLVVLRDLPAAGAWQAWHNVFVAINVFNPLIYISQGESTSGAAVQLGGSVVPDVVGALVLAAYFLAGCVGAALQWRRVEA